MKHQRRIHIVECSPEMRRWRKVQFTPWFTNKDFDWRNPVRRRFLKQRSDNKHLREGIITFSEWRRR